MLNSLFDAVFCINLDRRPDRLARFAQMAEQNNFTFTRWPATDALQLKNPHGGIMEENERRNAELACKISHARLIRYAQKMEYQSIMVFEDDARLVANWEDKFAEAINAPVDDELWHMFYLGFNDVNKTKEVLGDHVCRVRTGFTTHAYAISFKAYELALDALDYRGQADVLFADYVHPLGHTYSVHPNIAYQEDGFSDITLNHESYKSLK